MGGWSVWVGVECMGWWEVRVCTVWVGVYTAKLMKRNFRWYVMAYTQSCHTHSHVIRTVMSYAQSCHTHSHVIHTVMSYAQSYKHSTQYASQQHTLYARYTHTHSPLHATHNHTQPPTHNSIRPSPPPHHTHQPNYCTSPHTNNNIVPLGVTVHCSNLSCCPTLEGEHR